MAHHAHRMEQFLRIWEDKCLLSRAFKRYADAEGLGTNVVSRGAIRHSAAFRAALADAATKPFDEERFLSGRDNFEAHFALLKHRMLIPLMTWNWCGTSRRVIRLAASLQRDLEATSLGDMSWEDLRWPFPTMAISLETPMVENGHPFDFIVATRGMRIQSSERPIMQLFALGTEAESFLYDREELAWLNSLLLPTCPQRDLRRARGRLERLAARQILIPGLSLVDEGLTVETSIPHAKGERESELDSMTVRYVCPRMARLVANVCLWLQTLPAPSRAETAWQPIGTRERLPSRAVSNDARIFVLEGQGVLAATVPMQTAAVPDKPASDPTTAQGDAHALTPHFRSGYWKRWPGTGHDPDAPRILWTRPTIVRGDSLESGQLPTGAIQKLKP